MKNFIEHGRSTRNRIHIFSWPPDTTWLRFFRSRWYRSPRGYWWGVWVIFDQAKINRCRLLRKHRQREMFSTINSSRGFSFYYTGDQRTLWETFFPLLFPSMLINGLCRLEFFINRWISNFKVWNRRNRLSPESVQDIMMIYESERLQPEDDNEDEEITSQPQEDDQ